MRGIVLAIVLSIALANAAELLNVDAANRIDGEYIVVLHKHLDAAARDLHVSSLQSKLTSEEHVMDVYAIGDFIGYAARLSEATLISELKHPNVRYIEPNQVVSINEGYTVQQGINYPGAWGLARISARTAPTTWPSTYSYFTSSGSAVYAYIIDTGILTTHTEFANAGQSSRAIWGANFITGETNTDGNGHGTHVAGTVGGKTYGIAKQATLVAVKVLSAAGSGTIAGVVSGVQWTATNHTNRGRDARSVANMSLGGGASQPLDDAVTAAIAAGVTFAIAAGNNNGLSACNYSPARTPTAITVGATTNVDARASFSNIGTCVKVFAPGNAILSSYIGSDTATATLSGTSMAAPHVAGAVAVRLGNLLANGDPVPPTPAAVASWLTSVATPNVVGNPGTGSPNLLLYSPYLEPAATATSGFYQN